MKVLYIGGTGEISTACVTRSAALGHDVTVFNRGRSAAPLPPGVIQILGDLRDENAYRALGRRRFDVVCQFKAYDPADVQRDIDVFSGQTAQYLFISTASAYQKPPQSHRISEAVPLRNPFWIYSQLKADAEQVLFAAHQEKKFPLTVVRPSHTIRTKFPGTFIPGDDHAWRLINGRPVIIHGDGTALWTITAADDFAIPFCNLLGKPAALGEAFHITSDEVHSWNAIFQMMAGALGVQGGFVHVPSETLARYRTDFEGPLLGDKTWPAFFNNAKVKRVAGPFECRIPLREALQRSAEHFRRDRLPALKPDEQLHALVDRIAREQRELGVAGTSI